MMRMTLERLPEDPKPTIARLTIKIFEFGTAPQTAASAEEKSKGATGQHIGAALPTHLAKRAKPIGDTQNGSSNVCSILNRDRLRLYTCIVPNRDERTHKATRRTARYRAIIIKATVRPLDIAFRPYVGAMVSNTQHQAVPRDHCLDKYLSSHILIQLGHHIRVQHLNFLKNSGFSGCFSVSTWGEIWAALGLMTREAVRDHEGILELQELKNGST